MSTVIKVENISKQYRLGEVGTGTIANDLNRWWQKMRGKEDPYLKIGETNDRTAKGGSDYVWALKDINFEVQQGDVLGIIGRNGAGKSTLLKILSKTTTPTTGSIKIKGRIASLLEVGTGFHPELSGRDNIFLNGAILGMTKQEIKSKFDEIVDFAGVERYIDTPVKRYSSGMYVRLAFAVAAHLDPEILIVDEVLAVGDAEFQKKALGKMKEVSDKGGRTVLFVSHNLLALQQLCPKSILLNNGKVEKIGFSNEIIRDYLAYGKEATSCEWKMEDEPDISAFENPYFFITRFYLQDKHGSLLDKPIDVETDFIYLIIEGEIEIMDGRLSIGFLMKDENNNVVINNKHTDAYPKEKIILKKGKNVIKIKLNTSILNEGEYSIEYNCGLWNLQMINAGEENRISIKLKLSGLRGDPTFLTQRRESIIAPVIEWTTLN